MADRATQQPSNPATLTPGNPATTYTASIIAIGSEMLGPTRVDTNSLKVTAAFESFGIGVVRNSVVGDTFGQLVDEIRYSLAHAGILITSGGLGPTEDDMTRDALKEALGLEMEVDAGIIERLEKRFAARGWVMPEVNKRQANVFIGQTTLTNDRGTAPGFHIKKDGKHIWVFPGVPHPLCQSHYLREAAKEEKWNLNFGGIALMWRGGCIIRSRFLGKIKEAYDKNPQLTNLLLDEFFSKTLNDYQASWRRGIIHGIQYGVPTPAFSTALSFYDGYRTARLPANLLQAQRDFFGAHTFERIDKPRGQFFHTNWTGRGGRIASGSYNA